MPDLTRRGFLRSASIGAAAMSALSLGPTLARADGTSPMPSPAVGPGTASAPAMIPAAGSSALPTAVVIFFDDLSSGKGQVFIGEQAIEFDNPALVQSVQAIVG